MRQDRERSSITARERILEGGGWRGEDMAEVEEREIGFLSVSSGSVERARIIFSSFIRAGGGGPRAKKPTIHPKTGVTKRN